MNSMRSAGDVWDVELRAGHDKLGRVGKAAKANRTAAQTNLEVDPLELPGLTKRIATGVFEQTVKHHDFCLILIE
jgi:hypothetical protein